MPIRVGLLCFLAFRLFADRLINPIINPIVTVYGNLEISTFFVGTFANELFFVFVDSIFN